jgi:hypothetical protein
MEENKNKRMLRQAQHEIRRALQPDLVEDKLSTYFFVRSYDVAEY